MRGEFSRGNTVRLDGDGIPFYLYGDVKVPVDKDTPQTALHDDPGFEAQTAGVLDEYSVFWQTNGSAVSSTAEAMAEARSVLVSLSAAGNQAVLSETLIAVEPGDDVEFWVFGHRVTGAPTVRCDLLTKASGTPDYFDTPATIQQTGVAQELTDTYAKYPQRFTVPDGHTVARLSWVVEAPGAASAHLDSSGSRLSRSSGVENVVAQTLLPANVNVTATSSGTATTLTGLSVTVESPGVSAVYAAEVDAVLLFGATAADCVVELHVDGVKQTGSPIVGAQSRYQTAHRKWSVKGLSAGSHTFAVKAYLSVATTVVASQDHTVLTVTRMQ